MEEVRPTIRNHSVIDADLLKSETETIYNGYLYKWSPSKMKGWQKRYFVLRQNRIEYF
jgi:hypothetical protein